MPTMESPMGQKLAKRQFIVGIVLLLTVVFLWTLSNFVTQALFEDGYEKPFLVTYFNTSAFTLYLLPFLWRWWRKRTADGGNREYQRLAIEPYTTPREIQEAEAPAPYSEDKLKPLTTRETADLAFVFCLLWFSANWAVNASLNYTSVASTTILSAMSGFFTLGIGRLFLVESLTVTKLAAVVTSFLGVLLVSVSDTNSSNKPLPLPIPDGLTEHAPRPMLGDLLALLSAFFYATYVILLKVRIRSESRIDMQLFFGFVGLFNILACWPIGLLLHMTGVELLELPVTSRAVGAVILNMFITLSSDYLYVLAMLKTTPIVVTVGLSLTIPLAVVGDFLLGKSVQVQVLIGALLVLISFVAVGMDKTNVDTP